MRVLSEKVRTGERGKRRLLQSKGDERVKGRQEKGVGGGTRENRRFTVGICNCAFFCAEGTIGTGRGGKGGFRGLNRDLGRGDCLLRARRYRTFYLVGTSISESLMRRDMLLSTRSSLFFSRDLDKINSTAGRKFVYANRTRDVMNSPSFIDLSNV